jgi:hypothetical protein
MQTRVTTVGPFGAAVANAIALSQSLAGPGFLTLNGPLVKSVQGPYKGGTGAPYQSAQVAFISPPQQVTITSAGNDSAATISIAGTTFGGAPISENLAGANAGVATSVLDYVTVTSVGFTAATASTVTVGTAGFGGSPWIFLDSWANSIVGAQVSVTGTVAFQILASYDDPNFFADPIAAALMFWDNQVFTPFPDGTASASAYANPAPVYVRIALTSGTGSARLTVNQTGSISR